MIKAIETRNPVFSAPSRRTRRHTWRKADLTRALLAAKSAGLTIGTLEIAANGSIRISTGAPADKEVRDVFGEWEHKL
jgi:hypothetical protein